MNAKIMYLSDDERQALNFWRPFSGAQFLALNSPRCFWALTCSQSRTGHSDPKLLGFAGLLAMMGLSGEA
jgi:hypothetical protein